MSNRVTIFIKEKAFSPEKKTYYCGAATVRSILGAYIPEAERANTLISIQTLDNQSLLIGHPNEKDTAKLSRVMQPGEIITILNVPGIGIIEAIAIATIILNLVMALYMLYLSFNLDREEDPDHKIEGGSNRPQRYGSCIEVFGKRKVIPPYAASETVEVLANDDQYLKGVFDFGVGKVTLEEEKIGAILLENFVGIREAYYEGSWNGKIGSGDFQPGSTTEKNYLQIYQRQRRRDDLFFRDFALQELGSNSARRYKPRGDGRWNSSEVGNRYSQTRPDQDSDTRYRYRGIILNTQPNTVEALVIIELPAGLIAYDDDDGDRKHTNIDFLFLYRDTASSSTDYYYGGWMHLREKREGGFSQQRKIVFPHASIWEVRVYAWTPGRGGDRKVDNHSITRLISVREDVDVLNTRRDHAIKELEIKSSDQLQGVISAYSAVAQRWLPIPAGNAESTNITVEATSSPAAAALYVLRQNPRIDDDQIDFPAFESWHTWCIDEITVPYMENGVETTKTIARCEYNDIFTSDIPLKAALSRIGRAGDAKVLFIDNKWTVTREFPSTTTQPEYLLTEDNCSNLEIKRRMPRLHHAIRVTYMEPDRDWQETELVIFAHGYGEEDDDSAGIKAATLYREFDAVGATSRAHAARQGYIALAKARFRNTSYSLTVGIEGLGMYPGQIVRLAHPDVREEVVEDLGVDERIIQGKIARVDELEDFTFYESTAPTRAYPMFVLDTPTGLAPFSIPEDSEEEWEGLDTIDDTTTQDSTNENQYIPATINVGVITDDGPKMEKFDVHLMKIKTDDGVVAAAIIPTDPDDTSSDEITREGTVKANDPFTVQFKEIKERYVKVNSSDLKITTDGTTEVDIKFKGGEGTVEDKQYGIDCIVRSVHFNSENYTASVVLEQAALADFEDAEEGLVPEATRGSLYDPQEGRNLSPPPAEVTQARFVTAETNPSLLGIEVRFDHSITLAQHEVRGAPGLFLVGERAEGETLTINTSEIDDRIEAEQDRLADAYTAATTTAPLSYKWKRGSSYISGETDDEYELVGADVGEEITAEAYLPTGYSSGSWTGSAKIGESVPTLEIGSADWEQQKVSQASTTIVEWCDYDPDQEDEDGSVRTTARPDNAGTDTEDNTLGADENSRQTLICEYVNVPSDSRKAFLPVHDHTGTYAIRVRNRDLQGNTSEWSDRYFLTGTEDTSIGYTFVRDNKPSNDNNTIVDDTSTNSRLVPVKKLQDLNIPDPELVDMVAGFDASPIEEYTTNELAGAWRINNPPGWLVSEEYPYNIPVTISYVRNSDTSSSASLRFQNTDRAWFNSFFKESRAYFAVFADADGESSFPDDDLPSGGDYGTAYPGSDDSDGDFQSQAGWTSNPFFLNTIRTGSTYPYKDFLDAGGTIHIYMTRRLFFDNESAWDYDENGVTFNLIEVIQVSGATDEFRLFTVDDNGDDIPALNWSTPEHVFDMVSLTAPNLGDTRAVPADTDMPDNHEVSIDVTTSTQHNMNPIATADIGEHYGEGTVPPGVGKTILGDVEVEFTRLTISGDAPSVGSVTAIGESFHIVAEEYDDSDNIIGNPIVILNQARSREWISGSVFSFKFAHTITSDEVHGVKFKLNALHAYRYRRTGQSWTHPCTGEYYSGTTRETYGLSIDGGHLKVSV